MKLKRIISLFLCVVMICGCLMPLTACGEEECTQHVDENADGKCDKCENAVTIDCTTHIDANSNGKCDNCGATVTPAPAGQTNYTINVKTIGGMALSDVLVYVWKPDGNLTGLPKQTDANGNVTFTLDTLSGYTISLQGVPQGYNVKSGDTPEERYNMSHSGAQILLSSKPVTEGSLKNNYNVGDVMYDFTINDVDGNAYKLSELLETKKMVMLNFWYIDCSWCNKEFPGLNDAYKNYDDKLEILALNDYSTDSLSEVKTFPTTGSYEGEENNLVFPFFKISDSKSLTIGKFGGFAAGSTGYPTTIIIDRYGVICMIEQGAIVGEAKWNKIFDHFTSDNYTQKLIEKAEDLTPAEKPNVDWPGNDAIAGNFNASSSDITVEYHPEVGDEYSWPFVTGEKDGIKYVKPSNNSDNSYSILYAEVQLKPGQAVVFDYFSSCEYSNDRLVVIVDKDDICSLTGVNQGNISDPEDWEQCCAFVDPRPVTNDNKNDLKTYSVAFVYIKDTETSAGDDTVYLKDLRVIGVDEITTQTYIIREAVSGLKPDKTGYTDYVPYVLGDDGYYHVSTKDGPLLLVNFLGYTNFDSNKTVSQRVMDAGELMVGGVDKYYNWLVYANASANSTMYGFSPVTEELKEILDAYCSFYRTQAGKTAHADLWLQLCSYYDAYGKDENDNPTPQAPDPIKGLTTISAFEIEFNEDPQEGDNIYSVTYDRVVMPRGYLYKFTPKTSGVYRITSHANQEVIGWIFTGSSLEWMSSEDGERDVLADFEEEERHCEYLNVRVEDDDDDPTNDKYVRDLNNVSLVAYMEADKDYYIDIAYDDLYAVGTFEFEIIYEGASSKPFVMASPGPVTFIETSDGSMGGLIALGIDYAFKEEGGIKYAYQVIKRDEHGEPEIWGDKIYADFYYPTIPFPKQSIEQLASIGAFNFSITELDREAKVMLADIIIKGKAAIINEGQYDENYWTEHELEDIMLLLQKDESVSSYPAADVAIATEALAAGILSLKKDWGIEMIGGASEWAENDMDNALSGTLSSDPAILEAQQTVLAGIERYWNVVYKMDDVAKGIYHGEGNDETDTINRYIDLMDDGTAGIERQGCVAVTEELSQLLSQLYSKYNFEDVKHDWLKFCFYYKHLG